MQSKVICKIKGKSSLLMHRFPIDQTNGIDKMSAKDQAEISAYRSESGNLYLPGVAVQRALIASAAFSKGKGRATLQKPVAACVLVDPVEIDLGTKDYIIDSRAVVIPATKGRIVRHRPRLDVWEAAFEIEYDNELLSEEQLRQVIDDAGSRVGLLDFRPEKKGPFGRFMVVGWNVA